MLFGPNRLLDIIDIASSNVGSSSSLSRRRDIRILLGLTPFRVAFSMIF